MRKKLELFLEYIKKYKKFFIIGFVVLLVIDILDLAPPLIVKFFIDYISTGGREVSNIVYYASMFVFVTVMMGICRYAMSMIFGRTSHRIVNGIRKKLYLHMQTLSTSFYNRTRIGDIMSRATNDLRAVRMVYGRAILFTIDVILNLLFIPPILFALNWKLALCAIATMPLLPVFVNKIGNVVHYRFERVQAKMSDISAFAQENIAGVRVVKAYTQEKNVVKDFRKLGDDYVNENLKLARWWAVFIPTMLLAIGINSIIVLLVGGSEVIKGRMALGSLAACQLFLFRIMWPLIAFGWTVSLFQRGSASMKRINRILDTEPEIKDDERTKDIRNIEGTIEFRNLNFSYDGVKVLKNIDLKIEKGTTLAIVGQVGTGKSTLANLIPRLLDPDDGELFIDGVDVKQIPVSTLRANIGYVPQETFLFSESIKANILFGKNDATEAEMLEAAEVSQISRDVEEFPDKYETLLGEKGVNLSGGQKQRTAISRAVIRKPKILILDDALSSVDTQTEEEILKRLKAVMKQRTSIIISHRISTLKDADKIIVLQDGEIVEEGDHKSLLALNGIYADIYQKQLLEEELEEDK